MPTLESSWFSSDIILPFLWDDYSLLILSLIFIDLYLSFLLISLLTLEDAIFIYFIKSLLFYSSSSVFSSSLLDSELSFKESIEDSKSSKFMSSFIGEMSVSAFWSFWSGFRDFYGNLTSSSVVLLNLWIPITSLRYGESLSSL